MQSPFLTDVEPGSAYHLLLELPFSPWPEERIVAVVIIGLATPYWYTRDWRRRGTF